MIQREMSNNKINFKNIKIAIRRWGGEGKRGATRMLFPILFFFLFVMSFKNFL